MVAFIAACADAMAAMRGKPDRCVVCSDTWQGMLAVCNRQDFRYRAPKGNDARGDSVFRGVTVEVGRQRPDPDAWSFEFVLEQTGAAPVDPVATAEWKRKRRR